MSGKVPAFLFYPGDWLKDPKLSLCTPAARGVWIDLLCAMHELDRSGELRGTTEQLARIARCSTAEIAAALTELQTTGAADVAERNSVVSIINRRMKREHKCRSSTVLRVQRHRTLRAGNVNVTTASSSSSSRREETPPPTSPPSAAPQDRSARWPNAHALLLLWRELTKTPGNEAGKPAFRGSTEEEITAFYEEVESHVRKGVSLDAMRHLIRGAYTVKHGRINTLLYFQQRLRDVATQAMAHVSRDLEQRAEEKKREEARAAPNPAIARLVRETLERKMHG